MSELMPADPLAFLAGGGKAERMIRDRDWTGHPLGSPETWPTEFKAALSLVLNSPESMILAWGPDLSFFFNETYFPLLGPRLPWAMGERFDKVWADGWAQAKPIIDAAFAGRPEHFDDLPWKLGEDRGARDTWWSFSYSRVLDANGEIAGLFIFTNETTAKVLGDAALRESEASLRLVVEGAKDHAILTTDAEGVIRTWSRGAQEIFEWKPNEAIGQPAALIFTAEDRAAGIDARELTTAAERGVADDKRWHVTKSGRRVYMNGSVHPLSPDAQGRPTGFMKIARDDTERWEAEQITAREAEQERLSLKRERDRVWDLSRDMLGVADDKGVWLTINPAWKQILGWDEGDIVGRTSEWMEHPDDKEKTRAEVDRLAAGDPTYMFVNRFRTKTGDYRTISWTAEPESGLLYCVARDITDERRSAAALRLFENIVESDASPVVAWDANFQLVAFNRAHREAYMRVYGIEQRLGDSFLDQFVPEQVEFVRGFMERALSGETFTVRQEFGDPALEKPSWEIAYAPLRDESGNIIGAFHHAKDITVEVRAAAELASAQEALRQSQKMEAVGQLTGGLAHDFNNLLAGISGALELMGIRIRQGRITELEKYMVAAQGAAKRAAALTHRLLAFSRRQTLTPKPTNVNNLVRDMLDLIQRTAGPSIRVDAVTVSGLWTALVDAPQLENALLNLCINARDAMPEGGNLTIETANRYIDRAAAMKHDMPEGQYLSLCVSDTGTGMTPDVIEKAFDPFFTTKPIGQGTGLGLSMIYGFAKQSGGQARIYSEVGQGTMVCIYLPRHRGTADADEVTPDNQVTPLAEAGETVLVVDDEPTVRLLITDVLADLGYTAVEAADSAGGLRVLESDARVDLLITDVGLPGMNGRQMVDAALIHRPDLKVLFITGFAENALLNNGQLEPGMSVLTKPFAVDTLAARVRELIAGTVKQ